MAVPLGWPRVRIAGLDTTGRKQEAPPSLMDVMLARKGRGVLQLHRHLHQPARIAMLANTVIHLLLQSVQPALTVSQEPSVVLPAPVSALTVFPVFTPQARVPMPALPV